MTGHRTIAPPPYRAMRQRPDGTWEKPCRWCDEPLVKADGTMDLRRNWHPGCVDLYLVQRSSAALRRVVLERDGGLCAGCGATWSCSVAQQAAWRAARAASQAVTDLMEPTHGRYAAHTIANAVLRTEGLYDTLLQRDWQNYEWEADHIVPLIDGGPKTLDNVQTLCLPCHRAKTAREASERARRRRGDHMAKLLAEAGVEQPALPGTA